MPGSDTERALVIEVGTKTGVPVSPWTRPTQWHVGSGPGHCQACRDLAERALWAMALGALVRLVAHMQ